MPADLFEPLREQLRQRGWRQVQCWSRLFWQPPESAALYEEDEALRQLQRLQAIEEGATDE